MKKNLITTILMTIATTVLLGILYPLLVTGIAQAIFPKQANGELIRGKDGVLVGSRLIGQPFSGPGYFHSRPSGAGSVGYDATASGGSQLGPTNAQLITRVNGDVAKLQAENPGIPIPVDMVTTSASGSIRISRQRPRSSRSTAWRRNARFRKRRSRASFKRTPRTGNGDSWASHASTYSN